MTTLVGRLTLEQRTDRALAKLREACIAGADDAYVIQLAERLARRVTLTNAQYFASLLAQIEGSTLEAMHLDADRRARDKTAHRTARADARQLRTLVANELRDRKVASIRRAWTSYGGYA